VKAIRGNLAPPAVHERMKGDGVLVSRRLAAGIFAVVLGAAATFSTTFAGTQDPVLDCLSEDNDRRISGCSALIATPGLPGEQLSLAHGLRALAYSLKGQYEKALADYDTAIGLNPDFAVALNNRAWLYFKTGRLEQGVADVEHALRLAPASPYALDTRAHIRQSQGATREALGDYERAMRFGGRTIVKLYQCGLRSQGVYSGALDGIYSDAVSGALRTCLSTPHCDPLPEDSDCRPTVS
jgi:tetratricopeptide (TPR) repeat protein